MPKFTWQRYGGYDCSLKGDNRFSAFTARMLDGRSIEIHYQCDVKGYDPGGWNWRLGKGKPPLDKSKDLFKEYLALWVSWGTYHPVLMQELYEKALLHGGVLSDCFATTSINQAHALSEILNMTPKKQLIYAGIGSRSTPPDILELMTEIGTVLANRGWILRSGYADGADIAFHMGAIMASKGIGNQENYLPWPEFNNCPPHMGIVASDLPNWKEAIRVAASIHPNWNSCSTGAQKLLARNTYQIAGKDLDLASNCVICWTPNGQEVGGTAQAIRLAKTLNIPVFNLALADAAERLNEFIYEAELQTE